jgi:universal stress protein E
LWGRADVGGHPPALAFILQVKAAAKAAELLINQCTIKNETLIMSLYKNLFVVIDPTRPDQPALARAMAVSQRNKARVTAFSAVYKPVEQMLDASSRKAGKQAELKSWEKQVKDLVAPYKAKGLKVKQDTYWTADWYAAVSRAALRAEADLVIKSTFRHGKLQRLLHSTSDFTIMRHSPAPVLLVRERKSFSGKVILAALDLVSKDEGHMGLNNAVVKNAREMAEFTGLPLHVIAAVPARPDFSHLLAGLEDHPGGEIAALADSFGVALNHFHVQRGDAKRVIVEKANALKADIVVLGVSARSGVQGVLVGSTAQKILDKLDCDVLAVN